jgi:hypothetical protein
VSEMRVEFEWAGFRRGQCVGSDRLLVGLAVQARVLVSVGKYGAGERKTRQFAGASVGSLQVPGVSAKALRRAYAAREMRFESAGARRGRSGR